MFSQDVSHARQVTKVFRVLFLTSNHGRSHIATHVRETGACSSRGTISEVAVVDEASRGNGTVPVGARAGRGWEVLSVTSPGEQSTLSFSYVEHEGGRSEFQRTKILALHQPVTAAQSHAFIDTWYKT